MSDDDPAAKLDQAIEMLEELGGGLPMPGGYSTVTISTAERDMLLEVLRDESLSIALIQATPGSPLPYHLNERISSAVASHDADALVELGLALIRAARKP